LTDFWNFPGKIVRIKRNCGALANALQKPRQSGDSTASKNPPIDAIEQRGQQRTWETAMLGAELADD
jgi:hypothetical protein